MIFRHCIRPLLFRLDPELANPIGLAAGWDKSGRAIVVNYGLPNDGAETVARQLAVRRRRIPIA